MFSKFLKPVSRLEVGLWVLVLMIVSIAVFGPLLVIQALNTLFGLSIPYTFETWSSVVIIHMFLNIAFKTK